MFVTTPAAFYSLRFITGVFEAGFFPGIVLYFTNWYPASRRGRIMGLFMSAIPISGLLGSPLSGWMMQSFAGHGGLAGWQWMFLLQGIPTVLLGFLVYVLLNDGIAQAKWLNTEEKQLLRADLDEDERQRRTARIRPTLSPACCATACVDAGPRVFLHQMACTRSTSGCPPSSIA